MNYLTLIPLILTEIIGDFGLKIYANNNNLFFLFIGLFGYVGVILSLIYNLKGSQIILVNAAWDGLSALIESIAAIIILKEKFNEPNKYVGLTLIIIGLFCLKIPFY